MSNNSTSETQGTGVGQAGFTLIELLVVIAIISVLSTVILIGGDVARARGRDANRVAQVRQVQTALELYFSDYGEYPEEGCVPNGYTVGCGCISFTHAAAVLRDEGYLGDIPYDPQHPDPCYQYQDNYADSMCGSVQLSPNYVLIFRGETDVMDGYTEWRQTGSGYRCVM